MDFWQDHSTSKLYFRNTYNLFLNTYLIHWESLPVTMDICWHVWQNQAENLENQFDFSKMFLGTFCFFWTSSLTDGKLSLLMECYPKKLQGSMQCDTLPLLFSSHLTEIASNDLFLFTDDSTLCRQIPSKLHCSLLSFILDKWIFVIWQLI